MNRTKIMNKNQKTMRQPFLAVVLASLLISGCGPGQFFGPTITPSPTPTLTPTLTPSPTPTLTPTLTPSSTPVPPTILGELIDTEGAVIGAEITLTSYENEDEVCVTLTRSGTTLSISGKEGTEECITPPEFASTTSGTEGQYRFSNISPGWYRMDFVWKLSKNPRRGTDYQGDFFILYLVSKKTPKEYSALAFGDIFYFSGKEDMVINFNYENPGY